MKTTFSNSVAFFNKGNRKIKLALFAVTALTVSCSDENSVELNNTPQNEMTLNKRIIFQTQSQNPSSNTKEIQYYSNNEIVADTIFDNSNQWIARKIISTNGTTKTFQTLNTSNEIIAHREEIYDPQGRITSRRTYVPENLIIVSFEYNSDNTITAYATNTLDGSSSQIAVYHKNSDGLIYKEFRNNFVGTPSIVESTLEFEGSKPTQLTFASSTSVVPFYYYNNPKPSNLLKSVNQLNNSTLNGLSLTKLAEEGNYYYKRNNTNSSSVTTTYQTDFNSNNYIEYYKSTYLGSGTTNQLTTEIFYYYN
ncbi:MAG: hypothetical protein ACK5RV_12025 [Flavobacterium sp.]|jgi:hypothetical protein|uniref:hypothetical protein n=1 Tax=Flavobacterium sp. TaxID=239 RepID=UPI0022BCC05A|nr:hypothetical protein [Flavobacterium sp.]MCZ8168130.1 hypothetical protein [Flavobacterium sp.]MCZ8296181.1 hypothetical protein [Flavobacterium sp.]